MATISSFLESWQGFLGSLIGGTLGVIGALIVARSGRRREDRVSAAYLAADLRGFLPPVEASKKYCKEDGNTFADACAQFALSGPRLSTDFGFHAARVAHADPLLPPTLSILQSLAEELHRALDNIEGSSVSPKKQWRQYENAFEVALDTAEYAETVLPVLDLIARPGLGAAMSRLMRRIAIRWGDAAPILEVPEDVRKMRPVVEEERRLPDHETWEERLSVEFDNRSEEDWEDVAMVETEPYSVRTSVELE